MFQFMKLVACLGQMCRAPMTDEEVAALKADHEKALNTHKSEAEKLKADLEKYKKPPEDDPDLAAKAKAEREANDKKKNHEKSLEAALNFNIQAKEFSKLNAGLIPKTVENLFVQAEKETYDSAVEKANAIKVGIIQEFFAVQANHDLLTGGQKVELEDFLKLTKNGKQDRVENVYSMIFEPTLETLRKIEKAKQVGSGGKDRSDSEKALADRMMKQSKQHYLGDKA